MQVNLEQYVQHYRAMVDFGSEDSLENLSLTKTTIIYTTVLIEVVALASILMIVPIFHRIQQEREDILVLFGSFGRDKLEPLVNKYEDSAFAVKDLCGLAPNQMQHVQRIAKNVQYKHKVQSQTTSLPKYSALLIAGALLSFCFISIAPAVNCGVTYFTLDSFRDSLEELRLVLTYKSDVAVLFAANYARLALFA